MADFTKTITNGLNIFGGKPPSLWGSAVFGTDYWGFGSRDQITTVYKLFSESLTLSDQIFTVSTIRLTFTATLVVSGDQAAQMKIDLAGYKYVFGVDQNAENRPLTSYNSVAGQTTSYTTVTNTQTSWTTV